MKRTPALLALAVLTGCSASEPALVQPAPGGAVAADCTEVMKALPSELVGRQRTGLQHNVATWGRPRISVRCGVDKPAGLTPTSRCDVLNGIGWYAEEPGAVEKAWRFTTIGRRGYIEVIVPEDYSPAADVLIELTEAVKKMPQVKPCV